MTKNNTDPTPRGTVTLGQVERIIVANERNAKVLVLINAMKARGITTLVGIANELNKRGIPAPRGGQWTATQVSRVL